MLMEHAEGSGEGVLMQGTGGQRMELGNRREREGGRGGREVSRTLRLLGEPGDANGAQLYRLPLSYQRDFVCKMHQVEISIAPFRFKWRSEAQKSINGLNSRLTLVSRGVCPLNQPR